jgi:type IV pilus assembly protein PilA
MNAMITKNFKKKNKKNKGFTLVELIIVIAIIAVLGVILAPQYIKYVDRSRWATDQNNAKTLLKEVQTAVVDVQEAGGTLPSANVTIEINKSNDKVQGVDGLTTDLKNSLTNADANWQDVKVTNKGKADGAKDTFTITVTNEGQVTGKWND